MQIIFFYCPNYKNIFIQNQQSCFSYKYIQNLHFFLKISRYECIYFIYKTMEKYKTIRTLGDGAFGTVYKATNTKTGETVAIKKMKQKYTNWNECIELRQIKSLRKLDHPNIIKLKQVLLVAEELYMVFEYLDYNLYEVYSKMKEEGKKFTEKEIKSIVFQIASGLANMHKNGFFHRDMKPQNLLIYNNVVKVCDLGLAREIRSRPPFTDYVSTRWYRAPELLLRSTSYNSPVDIFALGCIMAELYTLCPLFPGNNEMDQLNKIVKILGTPEKGDWPEGYKLAQSKAYYFPQQKGINLADLIPDASVEAIEVIESMLQYSSRKRPTASELLKHDYFKGVSIVIPQTIQKGMPIFEEKPEGVKLDTNKQDKNIDVFRATKEKFKQTRKHDAMESNLFRQIDVVDYAHLNKSGEGPDDIDSILKELEDKNNKKQSTRLPMISTKDKFYKQKKEQLRESKTEMKIGQFRFMEKEQWRNPRPNPFTEENDRQYIRAQDNSYKKMSNPINIAAASLNMLPASKKQSLPQNKFSYSFQPASIPSYVPQSKHYVKSANMGLALGFLPLPKQTAPLKKQDLASMNPYKF